MRKAANIFLIMGGLTILVGVGTFYGFISNSHTHSGERIELDKTTSLIGFGLFGLIFTTLGSVIMYYVIRQNKKRNILLSSGQKLSASICDINYNKLYKINSIQPRVVECVAKVNGHEVKFRSHNIWGSGQFEIGQEVTVFVDARNSANYWVEVGD
jgi:hypothetical protein